MRIINKEKQIFINVKKAVTDLYDYLENEEVTKIIEEYEYDKSCKYCEKNVNLKNVTENLINKLKEEIENYETVDETEDEWTEEETTEKEDRRYTPEELQHMSAEVADLKQFQALAKSIALLHVSWTALQEPRHHRLPW